MGSSVDLKSLNSGLDKMLDAARDSARKAAAGMAGVCYDNAQAAARHWGIKSGNLRGAVFQYYAEDESSDDLKRYVVSVRGRAKGGLRGAPHALLLEYGWKQKRRRIKSRRGVWFTSKSQHNPKVIPASYWLRTSFQKSESLAARRGLAIFMRRIKHAGF